MEVSLNSNAMLVGLSFGLPRQTRQLKAEAAKVETENHAKKGTVRASLHYWKETIGGKEYNGLGELQSFFNSWRAAHNTLTRYWDQGNRLLVAKLLPQYMEMREKFITLTPEEVGKFLDEEYGKWRNTAPDRMGDLFNEQDFPSLQECKESITWENVVTPLPEAQQLKKIAAITPDLYEYFEKSTQEQVKNAVRQVREETWSDLITPVQKIVDTLSKDRPRIFDSLLTNLHDIINLVPAFNDVCHDPKLIEFANMAKAELDGITAEDLRTDPTIKKQALTAAQALLASFGGLGNRKFIQ